MSKFRPAISMTALTASLFARPVWAQPAAAATPAPSFFGELVSIVLPLSFIILGLFLVLHFARRRYGLTGQGVAMSVVQVLPLGPRERLVLVRTRRGRVLAVGVSSQTVSLVAELDPSELPTPDPAASEPSQSPPKLLGMPLILRDLIGRRGQPRKPAG